MTSAVCTHGGALFVVSWDLFSGAYNFCSFKNYLATIQFGMDGSGSHPVYNQIGINFIKYIIVGELNVIHVIKLPQGQAPDL